MFTQAKAQCQANWNYQQTSTAPCNACFTDISTGVGGGSTIASWNWSFPGGTSTSSVLQNPCITYPPAGGTYWVCLTITTNTSPVCLDSTCKTVTVNCGTGIASSEQIDISLSVTNPIFSFADIHYSIPTSGSMELVFFDIVGNKIGVLENGNKSAGMHSYSLNTNGFSKGVYFIHLNFQAVTPPEDGFVHLANITKKIIITE